MERSLAYLATRFRQPSNILQACISVACASAPFIGYAHRPGGMAVMPLGELVCISWQSDALDTSRPPRAVVTFVGGSGVVPRDIQFNEVDDVLMNRQVFVPRPRADCDVSSIRHLSERTTNSIYTYIRSENFFDSVSAVIRRADCLGLIDYTTLDTPSSGNIFGLSRGRPSVSDYIMMLATPTVAVSMDKLTLETDKKGEVKAQQPQRRRTPQPLHRPLVTNLDDVDDYDDE